MTISHRSFVVVVLLACLGLLGCEQADKGIKFSGQVFVRTQGGDTIKFSAVTVTVVPHERLAEVVGRINGRLAKLTRTARIYDDASLEAVFDYSNFTQGCASTQTDADGNFQLDLPTKDPDRYYFFATAKRRIGDEVETLCWSLETFANTMEQRNGRCWIQLSNTELENPEYILPRRGIK